MNIFFLDFTPKAIAQAHCDKHVVKMITETMQMLSCSHQVNSSSKVNKELEPLLYKKAYENHPCSKWIRQSSTNYLFTCHILVCLVNEYMYRYQKYDNFQTVRQAIPLLFQNIPDNIPQGVLTVPPCAMDDQYKIYSDCSNIKEVVLNYRNYYLHGKTHLLKYTRRNKPTWIEELS